MNRPVVLLPALPGGFDAPPIVPRPVAPPSPDDWPTLWARCWSRVRSWRVPPRWSHLDWWDEARAQGALAACLALREFDERRGVPRDAFLYRRVVEGVWTLYRQEWSFGRRFRDGGLLPDRPAPDPLADRPDPELLDRLASLLNTLPGADRRLLLGIYWDGRSEDDLALQLGITRQAVNKRKQKILRQLRSDPQLQRASRAEPTLRIRAS